MSSSVGPAGAPTQAGWAVLMLAVFAPLAVYLYRRKALG